jgi:hypothetical protein
MSGKASAEQTAAGMRKAALAWMSGARIEKCAELAGVDRATIWRWMRSPSWAGACETTLPELHGEMVRNARAVLMHHLTETKDAKVAMFVLERLTPGEWGPDAKQEAGSGAEVVVTIRSKRAADEEA